MWKKYDANPFTNMLGGLAQAPVFIGFFSAIRAMAAAKVVCQNMLLSQRPSVTAEFISDRCQEAGPCLDSCHLGKAQGLSKWQHRACAGDALVVERPVVLPACITRQA